MFYFLTNLDGFLLDFYLILIFGLKSLLSSLALMRKQSLAKPLSAFARLVLLVIETSSLTDGLESSVGLAKPTSILLILFKAPLPWGVLIPPKTRLSSVLNHAAPLLLGVRIVAEDALVSIFAVALREEFARHFSHYKFFEN